LLDEGLERKREAELKELYDGMSPDWTYLWAGLDLDGAMERRVLGETHLLFSPWFDFFPFVLIMQPWKIGPANWRKIMMSSKRSCKIGVLLFRVELVPISFLISLIFCFIFG
jgi:hypothetical protein